MCRSVPNVYGMFPDEYLCQADVLKSRETPTIPKRVPEKVCRMGEIYAEKQDAENKNTISQIFDLDCR